VSARPLVSVIVPAYNAERFLGDALQSIFDQDFDGFEVLVVDDGSTDRTAEVAAGFDSVTLVQQSNGGVARARNSGLAVARGRFVAFLDADDRWLPHKLRLQLDVMQSASAPDYVLGRMQNFVDDGFVAPEWVRASAFEPYVAHSSCTMLVARSAFDRIGGFDPHAEPAETMDWFARATDAGLVGSTVDELVALRRLHASNFAAYAVEAVNQQLLGVLRRSVERKRTDGASR
jgi:glycosyltransferase involved in cell wall biosynthesis